MQKENLKPVGVMLCERAECNVQLAQLGCREKAGKACLYSQATIENLGKLHISKVQTLELE